MVHGTWNICHLSLPGYKDPFLLSSYAFVPVFIAVLFNLSLTNFSFFLSSSSYTFVVLCIGTYVTTSLAPSSPFLFPLWLSCFVETHFLLCMSACPRPRLLSEFIHTLCASFLCAHLSIIASQFRPLILLLLTLFTIPFSALSFCLSSPPPPPPLPATQISPSLPYPSNIFTFSSSILPSHPTHLHIFRCRNLFSHSFPLYPSTLLFLASSLLSSTPPHPSLRCLHPVLTLFT